MFFLFLQKEVYGSMNKKEIICVDELYNDASIEFGKANYQGKYVGYVIKFFWREFNLKFLLVPNI